ETTDGGIAGHRADGREPMGDQGRLRAHPRSRGRGFAAGVAATDNDDVEGVRLGNHAATSIPELENAEARISGPLDPRLDELRLDGCRPPGASWFETRCAPCHEGRSGKLKVDRKKNRKQPHAK